MNSTDEAALTKRKNSLN